MQEPRINSTHKIKATVEQLNEMLEYYKAYLTYNTSDYIIARAKVSRATITFYKTNVVLFQGELEANEYNIWAKKYHLELDETSANNKIDYSKLTVIGTDEVGTGDYFGPIVVCATYVRDDQVDMLKKLGVKDSKLLTDKQMIPLALKLIELIPYSTMMLEPARLNKLSPKFSNLNYLKAYLHNKVINSILEKLPNVKYDAILIDEFTPKDKYLEYLKDRPDVIKNITTIPRGEKEHIAIAAASVIARVTFLRQLTKLANKYDVRLLKGAGPEVDHCAIDFVKNYGYDQLEDVAKLKFANTTRVKEYFMTHPLPKQKQGKMYD